MEKRLFVGGLSWDTTEESLKTLFAEVGTVTSAQVIVDRDTGKSKGFGFVEMSTSEEASEAINRLNGKQLDGRAINVSEARPREERNNNRGGGGRGGYSNRY